MVPISSCCPAVIRSASRRISGLAPLRGARAAMASAWAWCPIMSVMKRTSASV